MLALKITEIKEFMNHLLMMDTFDEFRLVEAGIIRAYTVNIDGRISPQFYTDEEKSILGIEEERFLKYAQMRQIVLGHIKGKRTPLLVRMTLSLPAKEALGRMRGSHDDIDTRIEDFLINIKYDSQGLLVTTGVSYSTFSMEKDLERLWDDYICEYLRSQQIIWEK